MEKQATIREDSGPWPTFVNQILRTNNFWWREFTPARKLAPKMEIVKSRQNKASGASVLFNTKDNDGKTPAHHAVSFSSTVFNLPIMLQAPSVHLKTPSEGEEEQ